MIFSKHLRVSGSVQGTVCRKNAGHSPFLLRALNWGQQAYEQGQDPVLGAGHKGQLGGKS